MRTFDENYYTDISLKGTRPEVPDHSSPELYGLALRDAIHSRLRYLRTIRKRKQSCFDVIQRELLNKYDKYTEQELVEAGKELDKVDKDIKYNLIRLKNPGQKARSYDLVAIKRIPMDTITEIMPNRFFRNNPFRQENSPSNSLYWYPKENRCMDFGSAKSYDVADLYCAINKTSTIEAFKALSGMI